MSYWCWLVPGGGKLCYAISTSQRLRWNPGKFQAQHCLDFASDLRYTASMVKIGRRIVVYGPTGSGKTTMAAHLARRIGVPHIELDAIHWLPGWKEKPPEEFRADVSTLLSECTDGWVFDGNYSKVRDLVLPLADTVVWLRPPLRVAFWRILKRTISRAWRRQVLWGTNRESWRLSFLSRDSLLLYQMNHWRRHHERTRRALEEIPHRASVLELRSVRAIEEFLVSPGLTDEIE